MYHSRCYLLPSPSAVPEPESRKQDLTKSKHRNSPFCCEVQTKHFIRRTVNVSLAFFMDSLRSIERLRVTADGTRKTSTDRGGTDATEERTDGQMDGSFVVSRSRSLKSFDRPLPPRRARNDMRSILHDEDESAPRQRFIVMASHSFNDIAWLREAR